MCMHRRWLAAHALQGTEQCLYIAGPLAWPGHVSAHGPCLVACQDYTAHRLLSMIRLLHAEI